MSAKTFDDVLARVRRTLGGDGSVSYWPDDELADYIDEGQLQYCRKTGALRKQFPLVLKENQETYTLPPDIITILRMENQEGDQILPTSSDRIEMRISRFRGDTDTYPEYFYADLDGENSIRFYPRPNPSVEADRLSFACRDLQELTLRSTASGGWPGVFYDEFQDVLYVADDDGIHLIDPVTFDVNDTYAHGHTTSTGSYTLAVVPPTPDVTPTEPAGTIYVSYGDKIRRVTNDGTSNSLYATAAADVDFIHPIAAQNAKLFYSSAGDVFMSNMLAYSGSTLTTSPGWNSVYSTTTGKQYFAIGAGIMIVDYVTGTIDSTENVALAAVNIAKVTDSEVYYVTISGGGIYVLDSSWNETALKTGSIYDLRGRGDYLWYADVATNVLYRYNASTSTEETCGLYSLDETDPPPRGPQFPLTSLKDGVNLFGYSSGPFPAPRNVANVTQSEEGCVAVIDSLDVDSEFGALVDIATTDNDELFVFDGEEGAVVEVVQDTDAVLVWATREPVIGLLEITEPLALEYYALYKAYQKDAEQAHLAKSEYYYRKYRDMVAREKAKRAGAYVNKSAAVQGYYY